MLWTYKYVELGHIDITSGKVVTILFEGPSLFYGLRTTRTRIWPKCWKPFELMRLYLELTILTTQTVTRRGTAALLKVPH